MHEKQLIEAIEKSYLHMYLTQCIFIII